MPQVLNYAEEAPTEALTKQNGPWCPFQTVGVGWVRKGLEESQDEQKVLGNLILSTSRPQECLLSVKSAHHCY